MTQMYDPFFLSDNTTEEDKKKREYYVSNATYNIFSLYKERTSLNKAYDYYSLKRNNESLKGIQEDAGIGVPFEIQFEGFIRTRLQYLIGSFIERPFTHKVTCTNIEALDEVNEQKKFEILSQAIDRINKVNKELLAKQEELKKNQSQELTIDLKAVIDKNVKDIENYMNTTWKSSFEIAANHLIEYFKHKGIKTSFKKLLEHLIISGVCHYRIHIEEIGRDPEIEIIDSRDLFYIKNSDRTFINECNRIVRRSFMTRQEVLNRYGHLLEEDELHWVRTGYGFFNTSNSAYNTQYVDPFWEYGNNDFRSYGHGELASNFGDILEVFHCEWLASDEIEIDDEEMINNLEIPESEDSNPKKIKRFITNRYECTRIGRWIYTKYGKSENILREIENPSKCKLSYNGIALDDFDEPFSLVLATADLQDQYDLIKFKRDMQINSSGIVGDTIVLENIPKHLGATPEERIINHLKNLKNGINLISLSQEGADTGFNNYGAKTGMTLEMQQIQGLNAVLDYYKKSVSEIIGVPDQMLGIIQEREAVANVQMSSIKTTVVTLPLYYTHGLIVKELITDLLNYSKLTYVKGKKGTYLLGDKQSLFTIEPRALNADFGLQVDVGTDSMTNLKLIKDSAMQFVQSQMMEAKTWTRLINAQSVEEAKMIVDNAFEEQKENQVTQLSQQLQEAQKQLEELTKQVKQLDAKKQQLEEKRLQLEEQRLKADIDYNNKVLSQEDKQFDKEVELKNKQIQTEIIQLYDDNKSNDEPINVI